MIENYTWYRTGRVTVLNGATTVTGINTEWVKDGIKAGDIFILMGVMCEVANVATNTELELIEPYAGESITGTAYKIIRLAPPVLSAEISLSLRELIDKWPQYEALIADYNSLNDSYLTIQDNYSKLLNIYQELVDKVNTLTAKSERFEKTTKFIKKTGIFIDEDSNLAQAEGHGGEDYSGDDGGDSTDPTTPTDDPTDDNGDIADDDDVFNAIDQILNP